MRVSRGPKISIVIIDRRPVSEVDNQFAKMAERSHLHRKGWLERMIALRFGPYHLVVPARRSGKVTGSVTVGCI